MTSEFHLDHEYPNEPRLRDLPLRLVNIPRILLRCDQPAHIIKQSPFPLADQLVECLFLSPFAAEKQQFQQDGLSVSRQR